MAQPSLEGIAAGLAARLVRDLLQTPDPEQQRALAEDARRQMPEARDRAVWQGRHRTEAATAHFASDPSGGPYGLGMTARDMAELQRFLLRGIVGTGVAAGRSPELATDLPLILLLASGYGFAAPGPARQDHHFRLFQVVEAAGGRQLRGLARPEDQPAPAAPWEPDRLPAQLRTPAGQSCLAHGLAGRILRQLAAQQLDSAPLLHAAAGANLVARQAASLLVRAAGDYYGLGPFLANRQLLQRLEEPAPGQPPAAPAAP